MISTFFAYLFALVTLITVLFQFALAAGMPWGNLAMGGRYPGKSRKLKMRQSDNKNRWFQAAVLPNSASTWPGCRPRVIGIISFR